MAKSSKKKSWRYQFKTGRIKVVQPSDPTEA